MLQHNVHLSIVPPFLSTQIVKPIPLRLTERDAGPQGPEPGSEGPSGSSSQSASRCSPTPGSAPLWSSSKGSGRPDSPGMRRRRVSPIPVSGLLMEICYFIAREINEDRVMK